MGYRNGKVDKINKMPFNDEFPFDDKDGKTWYQVGYRSGWDSGNSLILNNFFKFQI